MERLNEFEQEFLQRYEKGYQFTRYELRRLNRKLKEIAVTFSPIRRERCSRCLVSIFKVGSRYFARPYIQDTWRDLSEEFPYQPFEIEIIERVHMIKEFNWFKKEK